MAIKPRTACEVGYEPETVYEAYVNANVSIYFMFTRRQNVRRVSIMRSDVSDGIWTNYHIGTATEVNYYVPNGTWILRIHVGYQPDWLFKDKVNGTLSKAIISKAWGKHYDTVVEDDIASCATTPEDVKEAVKWYKKTKEEVKGKMYLQLIDVTIFNRKTKHIDFRENIIAENNDEAYLLAVQAFGKYNPKVHVKAANCILGFNEIGDKEED